LERRDAGNRESPRLATRRRSRWPNERNSQLTDEEVFPSELEHHDQRRDIDADGASERLDQTEEMQAARCRPVGRPCFFAYLSAAATKHTDTPERECCTQCSPLFCAAITTPSARCAGKVEAPPLSDSELITRPPQITFIMHP